MLYFDIADCSCRKHKPEKDGSMAETENAQIREVITPEAPKEDDGFELLDLDNNGIPDLLEDDEDVDASSDAQRAYKSLSHRAVTMTVDSTDGSPANSSPYYVSNGAAVAGYEDEEEDDDGYYDEDDDYDEDDYDDEEEDNSPSVAPAFRPDAPAGAGGKDELPVINGKRVERRKKPRVKKDPEFDLTHPDYTFTITKGLTNTIVKRKYLSHNRALLTAVALFLLALALLCFFVFSVVYMVGNERLKRTQATEIEQLAKENELLASKNNELSSTVTQLSRSVNRSIEDRRADEVAYEASLIPDGYPLSQSADMTVAYETDEPEQKKEETVEEDDADTDDTADAADSEASDETETEPEPPAERIPVALFSAEAGTRVIAAGGGVVTRVVEDAAYGYLVMIDHRNGYQSVYRCAGEPQVSVSNTVLRGDTLFVVEELPEEEKDDAATEEDTGTEDDGTTQDDDTPAGEDTSSGTKASFAYQILLNGSYINPKNVMKNP